MRIFTRLGIKLDFLQYPAFSKPIEALPLPKELLIPLAQPGCAPCYPAHPAGDQVLSGQALGFPEEDGCPVLAPVSGTVLSVVHKRHPMLGDVPHTLLKPLENGEAVVFSHDPSGDLSALSRKLQIIDELDGLPLYIKLEALRHNKQSRLYAAAVEEDVCPSSGCACLAAYPDEIGKGLRLAAKAVGASELGVVAVSSPRVLRHLPRSADHIAINGYSLRYPARAILQQKLGIDPSRLIGVQALLALSRAAGSGTPQTSFVVTVAGDALEKERNLRIVSGTPVSALLTHCGLLAENPAVILGSPMTGCLADLDTPLFPGIRSVIALSKLPHKKRSSCVECGRCARSCPKGLLPFYAIREATRGNLKLAKSLRPQNCVHCSVCSYVCPAGIDVSEEMQKTQHLLAARSKKEAVS